ncbi:Rieske (2Fe-2S) protein [Nocardioides rubriscoriae]|uniref:Rieske (2Fe-2S) protein n=1 Tax=Nocardioides rubriscoriae TaxID=642762 RepID=UPI0011DF8BBF|nr:Rieske (2Fe-2S) protein [Nocardioides rubriscoriae]
MSAADFRPTRRIVFQGLGALGVAAALAGCSGAATGGDGGGGGAVPEAGSVLATTSEVPVGGGIVLPDANLVLTQPTAGDFKAFSATCTHTGTQVNAIDGTDIVCPNHGSRFSITDGSVTNPPASSPLEPIAIKVDGDNILTA